VEWFKSKATAGRSREQQVCARQGTAKVQEEQERGSSRGEARLSLPGLLLPELSPAGLLLPASASLFRPASWVSCSDRQCTAAARRCPVTPAEGQGSQLSQAAQDRDRAARIEETMVPPARTACCAGSGR